MIPHKGDFRLGDVVEHTIASVNSAGASVTLGTNGTLRLYKSGSTTELATVVTLTEDFDGLTGVHRISLQLTGAGITPGAEYVVVLVGAVVDGATVNTPLFTFSCQNRGTWVTSRGQLAAVGTAGGTLAAGTFDRVNVGDRIRIVSASRADYRIIDSLDTGTGAFTLRQAWGTTPSVGDYYEVHEGVQGDLLADVDIATGAITAAKIADDAFVASKFEASAIAALQAGLASAADLATVDGVVDSILTGQGALATASAVNAALAALTDLDGRIPAALVGGKMDAVADVGAISLDPSDIAAIAAEVLDDPDGVEPGITVRHALRHLLAVWISKTAGLLTSSPEFLSADLSGGVVQGSKVRVSGSVNGSGDRVNITLDGSPV